MKIAVISDIHGNLEAFQEVLADIDRFGVDDLISLGDNIGYGPEPEQVMRLIQDRKISSVLGNHEMAVLDHGFLDWFNPAARFSLEKTIGMLSENSVQFIGTLKHAMVALGCRFVHGFPPESAVIYRFQVAEDILYRTIRQLEERICFIGHTHELEIVAYDGRGLDIKSISEGTIRLERDHRYIINIGSVGQPRDGNNQAKYVIWDDSNNELRVRFIPYDTQKVADKILSAGLPEIHALRLL
jgi:predicted phosphodiesterase